ncbi:MAG: helix-turn-helix transcriptional regulator [Clostridia bacterium]|nr:helix-turn-helix transcriptional regulator [Clostridia bacterium]MBO5913294.1 helix-turn-helix transcriptional regulator [Clostridia bacterium]
MELLHVFYAERDNFLIEDFVSEFDSLMLIEKGSFHFSCEGVEGVVNQNEALYFEKGIHYKRKVLTPITLHIFRFNGDHPFDRSTIKFKDSRRIESTMRLLSKFSDQRFPQKSEFVTPLFFDIVNQYRIEKLFSSSKTTDSAVQLGADFLKENCFASVTVEEAASTAGLSVSQFARRFKQSINMTPCEYLCELRLSKSEQLLVETDMSIKQISELCGFCNEYYFSQFFKKRTGVSPSRFRKGAI